MSVKTKFLGLPVVIDIVWTGSVYQRLDNGQQSARMSELVYDWLVDCVQAGGDDPAAYESKIKRAVRSAKLQR